MAKFNVGDKVRMAPDLQGTDYAQFRNRIGTIVGVGTYEYDVTFPENPGEAYEFYEEELTRVKSLPTTATKGTARFKTGDKVLVLPGNYRSGKVGEVVGFQDGDPAVQLEGLPEPEMFAEYELRLEKSLSTTDTKSLTWIKSGNEYHTLDGRWTIWGDDRRGFSLDDSERVHRSAPGAFDSVEEAKKQAERASQKSLPATKSLPQCSFCGKSLAGGSEVLEGSRRYHTKCFPSTSSVALRAKYIVRD